MLQRIDLRAGLPRVLGDVLPRAAVDIGTATAVVATGTTVAQLEGQNEKCAKLGRSADVARRWPGTHHANPLNHLDVVEFVFERSDQRKFFSRGAHAGSIAPRVLSGNDGTVPIRVVGRFKAAVRRGRRWRS